MTFETNNRDSPIKTDLAVLLQAYLIAKEITAFLLLIPSHMTDSKQLSIKAVSTNNLMYQLLHLGGRYSIKLLINLSNVQN